MPLTGTYTFPSRIHGIRSAHSDEGHDHDHTTRYQVLGLRREDADSWDIQPAIEEELRKGARRNVMLAKDNPAAGARAPVFLSNKIEKGSNVFVFQKLASVPFTVRPPSPSSDGSLIVKDSGMLFSCNTKLWKALPTYLLVAAPVNWLPVVVSVSPNVLWRQ